MTNNIEIPITFILSTGRTGTQFFSSYLTESCHDILCLHEPKPSRRFKWYSNFYLNQKISSAFVARQFLKSRQNVLKRTDYSHYVESSNFMFGNMPAIEQVASELSVIHLVREPLSYIRSHLNKGFWSGIKGFTARNIPGWLEFLDPEIRKSGDPVLILAARWIYVNRIIGSYQQKYPYLNIRFEDLFNADIKTGIESLNTIREFLQCPGLTDNQQKYWLGQRENQSPKMRASQYPVESKHIKYLQDHGKELLDLYNYKLEDAEMA